VFQGTKKAPFATVAKALAATRAGNSDAYESNSNASSSAIVLRAGTHYLTKGGPVYSFLFVLGISLLYEKLFRSVGLCFGAWPLSPFCSLCSALIHMKG
jgi:hypothetical protein